MFDKKNNQVDSEDKSKFQIEYQLGKKALETGQYCLSVQHLETASKLVGESSRWGGEVKIWLVTAYQAAGMLPEAIALCRELSTHPDLETRKQAKRLLYIIEAPQLTRPKEWMTEIPDLAKISEGESQYVGSSSKNESKSKATSSALREKVDLSEVNREDNQFIWVALLGLVLFFGGLIWFG